MELLLPDEDQALVLFLLAPLAIFNPRYASTFDDYQSTYRRPTLRVKRCRPGHQLCWSCHLVRSNEALLRERNGRDGEDRRNHAGATQHLISTTDEPQDQSQCGRIRFHYKIKVRPHLPGRTLRRKSNRGPMSRGPFR